MGRVFAYARVSTADQTVENRLLEIRNSWFQVEQRRVIVETISGSIEANRRLAASLGRSERRSATPRLKFRDISNLRYAESDIGDSD